MRKVRVLIQVGATKDYTTKQFVERDVTIDIRDEEDMTEQLRFLISEEFKQVKERLVKFPESRPLVEQAPSLEQVLIG